MRLCVNGATTMPYSLQEDLAAAQAAGFEGVEIWWPKLKTYLEDHTLAELRALVRASGLTVASICPFLLMAFAENGIDALEDFKRGAAIAEEIGCQTLLIGPDAPQTMGSEAAYQRMAEVVYRFAEIASEHGARIAIESLGGHPLVPGPGEALEIVHRSSHPAVGLVLDTHHCYKSGVRPEDVEDLPLDRLFLLHVNDSEDRPRAELQRWHRLYPGEGILPLVPWLRLVRAKGYGGFVSVEIFRPAYWEEDPLTICRKAKASLDRLLAVLEEVTVPS